LLLGEEAMSATDEDDGALRAALALRLREAREFVGLSQEEVAIALRISRTAVTHIESGFRKVEAVELNRLSALYGQSVDFLLEGQAKKEDARLSFLARATQGLTQRDMDELERFAAFLRNAPKKRRNTE
jgi:transcriptional regulator with XRE-family HTH domain